MRNFLKKNKFIILIVIAILVLQKTGYATGTDMPWEAPLDKLLKSFTGPVAKTVGILAVAACGGMMAFGEMGSAMKKMLNIVLGISIVFAASTWGLSFFGFAGTVQM